MKAVIALKDGETVEKNWVYRVVEENDTTYSIVEEFIGISQLVSIESKELFGNVTEEEYNQLMRYAEEDFPDEQSALLDKIIARENS